MENEIFLNNERGALLGTLDSKKIFMSGTGSMFPIYNKSMGNSDLWAVEIQYDQPEIDSLSESLKLFLNIDHPDYCMLDVNNKKYCPRLVLEIVSSAIVSLIMKLHEDEALDDLNMDYADGSVLAFVKYYRDVLELNIDDIISVSSSLRNYLNGKE